MKTNKKRRIEGQEAPKPMSAISALAARNRAAAGRSPQVDASPASDERPAASNKNFFSPLSKHGKDNTNDESSKKPLVKPSAQRRPKLSTSSSQTPDGSRHTSDNETNASMSAKMVQYSSFRLTKGNHSVTANGVIELHLDDSERFLIIGSFGIRVLKGEMTVLNATLTPSTTLHWIQAATCHAIPVLRTAENTSLEIHPDPNYAGLRRLERLSPNFRNLWFEAPTLTTTSQASTFRMLFTSQDATKRCTIEELVSPPEWNRKLSELVSRALKEPPLTTLVCGPKSAGKSTFSKLLTNRLLTESFSQESKGIAVLDLDPGQPEYTPAGTLALTYITEPNLCPPFVHAGVESRATKIVRCHSLASVSPGSDTVLYLECAMDLFATYSKTFPHSPLIINTPGWINGTGLDLLEEVIDRFHPQEVVYMSEEGPIDTVETIQSKAAKPLTTLPSQRSELTARSAAQLRAMQHLSYFHIETSTIADTEDTSRRKWNSSPLSTKPPVVVRYSGQNPGFYGILFYNYQPPPFLLKEAINGMILAIVEIENPKAFRRLVNKKAPNSDAMDVDGSNMEAAKPRILTSPESIPFIPNPDDTTLDAAYSRTVGLVLIRGVDDRNQTLQLLTPVPPEEMSRIKSLGHDIVLLYGKFDPPHWAHTEDPYFEQWTNEPNESGQKTYPWVETLEGDGKRPAGSKALRVRRDLGRNVEG